MATATEEEESLCVLEDSDPGMPLKAWAFTRMNPPEGYDQLVRELVDKCVVLVVGYELAPSTGTPHFQGYVRFKTSKRFSGVKKLLPGARIEKPKKPELANVRYCRKDKNMVVDFGAEDVEPKEVSARQKRLRRDEELEQIFAKIDEGADFGVLRKKHRAFCFWHRVRLIQYLRDERHYRCCVPCAGFIPDEFTDDRRF